MNIRYTHKYCIITDKKLAQNSIMLNLLLLASAEAKSVMSSQPNHLLNAFCHQAKTIHAESALIHVVNSFLLLFS